jgi:uncharacterized damage-inducible protein DinB
MPDTTPCTEALLSTWRTSSRVTSYLVEHIPDEMWAQAIPGAPRRTVRMIAGHIHNARCMWIKMLGKKHGVRMPASVNRRSVTRTRLLEAFARSSRAMEELLELGMRRGGKLGGFPLDMHHFLAYHVAHEGHHRGQLVMVARQLGCRLPAEVTAGLWQWSKRAKESGRSQ